MQNVLAVVGTAAIIAFSWAMALFGEPRSAWLWCDLLGFCG